MSKYLIQRPGCCWALRLPGNDGKMAEQSLGTKDKHEAEIIALRDYGAKIAAHKTRILARRPRIEAVWEHRYAPGRMHDTPAGKVFATDRELHFLDDQLRVVRTEPNGGLQNRVANLPPGAVLIGGPDWLAAQSPLLRGEAMVRLHAQSTAFLRGEGRRIVDVEKLPGWKEEPAAKVAKIGDDAIVAGYLDDRGVTGYPHREAEQTWELFRSLVHKPLKQCTKDDGRALVQYFRDQGLKSASIKKRLTRLCAAVNWAIGEGKLPATQINPFAGIVRSAGKLEVLGGDAMQRLPLSAADLELCRGGLAKLSTADQLLFRLLCTTGMRLGEAMSIDREEVQGGIRFVTVGTKTEASFRRVPLPASVLPYLSAKIAAPLFSGTANAASKRLNGLLRDVGIDDPAKSVHSLRHRAHDVLREVGCPEPIQRALLGHAKDIHAKYGEGHPLSILKQWVDKIDGV
jgi:integrase